MKITLHLFWLNVKVRAHHLNFLINSELSYYILYTYIVLL